MSNDSNDSAVRDISLVLFGFALAGDTARAAVFCQVKPQDVVPEVSALMEALLQGDRKPIVNWFCDRQVHIEGQQKPLEAMGKSIRSYNRRLARAALRAKIAGSQLLKDAEFVDYIQKELDEFKRRLEE